MREGKERIVAEHPKAWLVRMVAGRGLKVAEKMLYWWSVHLERLLKFCRSAGAESSEIPEGGLPSWSREARKLGVFPETFWRLQAPATAREISSWYQLTATGMQHLKSLLPREIVAGIVLLWITGILITRCDDTRSCWP